MNFAKIVAQFKAIFLSPLIKNFISDVFLVSGVTFFAYLSLEILVEGFVSNYFDLHIVLVIFLASGIGKLAQISAEETEQAVGNSRKEKKNLVIRLFFAIIMALVICYKLIIFRWLAVAVSVAAAIIIFYVLDEIE